MVRVILAQRVFALTGKAVWPWEVLELLPDDWLDTFRAYAVDVGEKAAKKREMEGAAKRKGKR